MLSCALAVLMVTEAVSPSGAHRPHQNQRAQIYHLRDWGARNLHFNNLPYLGFSQSPPSVSPREQGTGWNIFSCPSAPLVPWGMMSGELAEQLLNGNWKMKLEITASQPKELGFLFHRESP